MGNLIKEKGKIKMDKYNKANSSHDVVTNLFSWLSQCCTSPFTFIQLSEDSTQETINLTVQENIFILCVYKYEHFVVRVDKNNLVIEYFFPS